MNVAEIVQLVFVINMIIGIGLFAYHMRGRDERIAMVKLFKNSPFRACFAVAATVCVLPAALLINAISRIFFFLMFR